MSLCHTVHCAAVQECALQRTSQAFETAYFRISFLATSKMRSGKSLRVLVALVLRFQVWNTTYANEVAYIDHADRLVFRHVFTLRPRGTRARTVSWKTKFSLRSANAVKSATIVGTALHEAIDHNVTFKTKRNYDPLLMMQCKQTSNFRTHA